MSSSGPGRPWPLHPTAHSHTNGSLWRQGRINREEGETPPTSEPSPPGQPALTFAAHTIGGPVISIEVGWLGGLHHQVLHVPPGEVLTAKEGTVGDQAFWIVAGEPAALPSAGGDRLLLAHSLGLQGESNDASRQRGRSRGARVRLRALLPQVSCHLSGDNSVETLMAVGRRKGARCLSFCLWALSTPDSIGESVRTLGFQLLPC